jgi:hypothetical protein
MMVLNFAHPLTAEQRAQLAVLLDADPDVRAVQAQADRSRPLADVAQDLAEAAGLNAIEWQTLPFVVNPPGLAPLALALLAEIHGRCGYFPPIMNIRPVEGAIPPQYEVAELVDLRAVRDRARERR